MYCNRYIASRAKNLFSLADRIRELQVNLNCGAGVGREILRFEVGSWHPPNSWGCRHPDPGRSSGYELPLWTIYYEIEWSSNANRFEVSEIQFCLGAKWIFYLRAAILYLTQEIINFAPRISLVDDEKKTNGDGDSTEREGRPEIERIY